jgi:hypothetical protein
VAPRAAARTALRTAIRSAPRPASRKPYACAAALDNLEAEVRQAVVPVSKLTSAFRALTPVTGAGCRDRRILARAAGACIALLDDRRVLSDDGVSDGPTVRVRHEAIRLLEALTGNDFGELDREGGWGARLTDSDRAEDPGTVKAWRRWWQRSGRDVDRWLAAGDHARRRRADAARAEAIRVLTSLRFTTTALYPLEDWPAGWVPVATLEAATPAQRDGSDELKARLPPALASLDDATPRFFRDGDDVIQAQVSSQFMPGYTHRIGTWAAVGVGRLKRTTRPTEADYPARGRVLVWPRALGDLAAPGGPALDAAALAWIEASQADFHAHLLAQWHFEAWVLDGDQVRRVSLQRR